MDETAINNAYNAAVGQLFNVFHMAMASGAHDLAEKNFKKGLDALRNARARALELAKS